MKLTKAEEILDLNLVTNTNDMPPDVRDALKLGVESLKQLIRFRHGTKVDFTHPLKGETPPREGGD